MGGSYEIERDARLKAFAERLANPVGLLRPMAALILARAQRAFTDQRRGSRQWAPRAVPNVIGILEDLKRGSTPPERRFQPRPAGQDRGDLYRSVTIPTAAAYVGNDTVEVGSRLPYASDVQNGGERDVPVDAALKDKIKKYLDGKRRGTKSAQTKAKKLRDLDYEIGFDKAATKAEASFYEKSNRNRMLQEALGWLLGPRVKGFTAKIPARPFVMITDEDVSDFNRIIFREALRA